MSVAVPAYIAALQAVGLSNGQVPIYVPNDPSSPTGSVMQIGYWTSASDLCNAVVQIYSQYMGVNGQSVYPPSEWITNNDFGLQTPVSAYCASKNAVPSWAVAGPSGSFTVAQDVSGAAPISYSPQPGGYYDLTDPTQNPTYATGILTPADGAASSAASSALATVEQDANSALSSLLPGNLLSGTNGILLIGAAGLALFLLLRRHEA